MENKAIVNALEGFKKIAESAINLHKQALDGVSELESLVIIDLIKAKEYDEEWFLELDEDGETVYLAVGDYTIEFYHFGEKYDNEFCSITNGYEEIDPSAELQTLIEKL
jgi:hypothetical protein